MKRYKLNTEVVRHIDPYSMDHVVKGLSRMEESATGEWVQWADVERLKEHLEGQIPEYRIAKLEKALGLVHEGRCPECGELVRGYKSPSGSFAPEAWASLREAGINPSTGHKAKCSLGCKGG